ncbi:SDR family NAD(P)-dependent oxidoreductase [Clostridium sporogenes]|uniref:SDR family NAD(P)-dependent oxidoreductase n=1 Tax=Clostridium sporogenes TaxID=1509 RepID=A0AAE4FIL4_CLOSG|nr:SDR family NAD(P)-dependent oxidoreductase [Clostridium sporogenes]MDS1002894.1 SDR family NAD(P)-dependent oxidoreductase [Clostridium sporogenes]
MSYYRNKKILIIGGTGTIGQGMVKELLSFEPSVIRIFSRDEYKQFIMEKEIEDKYKNKLRFLIGDVRDYERVKRAMEDIDVVFNLAAMKHVPACEYNPTEAIKTNVIGMENVINAAIYNNVDTVIFTSSDKAISPTNSYGATKLLAERLVQSANYSKGKSKTKFVAVRFGNVMGSRGSVIPLFKKQILEQKRITITNDGMSRFMMTLSDAVKLTMDAAENSIGGEVFVLKMPVIKLKDLGEIVIEQTSKRYNISASEIKIKIIGLRPGEKMYEELMTEEESEYAYDLGNMYAILPTTISRKHYIDFYGIYKKANKESYSSHGQIPVSKEKVEEFILNEELI